jgi:hypothetical protein
MRLGNKGTGQESVKKAKTHRVVVPVKKKEEEEMMMICKFPCPPYLTYNNKYRHTH